MASFITLETLEWFTYKTNYKGWDGQSLVKIFMYQQLFGLYLRYRHHIYDHNNSIHSPILLDIYLATKLFPDRNFA